MILLFMRVIIKGVLDKETAEVGFILYRATMGGLSKETPKDFCIGEVKLH